MIAKQRSREDRDHNSMIDEENQLENAQTSTVGSADASSNADTFSPEAGHTETGHNGEVGAAEGELSVAAEAGVAESGLETGTEAQSLDLQARSLKKTMRSKR